MRVRKRTSQAKKFACIVFLFVMCLPALAEDADYVGSDSCMECHEAGHPGPKDVLGREL